MNKMKCMPIVLLCLMVISGCATKVTRVGVEEKIDLSGRWNDYDAQLVSEEMIQDCLKRPWLKNFVSDNERDPIIIVGTVTNRSHEHINAEVVIKYLERELINSGKVIFVASVNERAEIRQERDDQQQGLTATETIKKIGREKGADYVLIGSIDSVKDEVRGKFAVLYQVNLELVDLTTNQKVWIGQKQIKKLVERSQFSL